MSADRAHGGRRRGSWRQRWCRQRWCRPRPQRRRGRRGARPGRVHWHTQRGFRGTLARVRILERLPDARMRPSMSSMRWAGGVRSQPSSALRALEKTRAGCCTALSVSRRVVRPGRQKRGTGRSRSDPPPGRSIPDGLRCENTRRLPWKTRPNVNLTCEGGRTSANHVWHPKDLRLTDSETGQTQGGESNAYALEGKLSRAGRFAARLA